MKPQEQLAHEFEVDVRAEILDIYEEYNKFPIRIQHDLSFNDYLDFYLEQQSKSEMAKGKYLELVQDLFVNKEQPGVYEEILIDQNYQSDDPEIEE